MSHILEVIFYILLYLKFLYFLAYKFSFYHLFFSSPFLDCCFSLVGMAFSLSLGFAAFACTTISMFVLFALLLLFLPARITLPASFAFIWAITKLAVLMPLNCAFASTLFINFNISLDALSGYLPGPIFVLWPILCLNLLNGTAFLCSMTLLNASLA